MKGDTDRRFKCGDAVTWGGKYWAHRITSFCPEGVFVDATSAMGLTGLAYFVSWDGNDSGGSPLEIADFEPDEWNVPDCEVIEEETVELEITNSAAEILCSLLGGISALAGTRAEPCVREIFGALDPLLPKRTKTFSDYFEGEVSTR